MRKKKVPYQGLSMDVEVDLVCFKGDNTTRHTMTYRDALMISKGLNKGWQYKIIQKDFNEFNLKP